MIIGDFSSRLVITISYDVLSFNLFHLWFGRSDNNYLLKVELRE